MGKLFVLVLRCLLLTFVCVGGPVSFAREGVDWVSFAPKQERMFESRLSVRIDVLLPHVQKMLLLGHIADVGAFARQLIAPARNDQERAWLVYRWVAGRAFYDLNASARLGLAAQRSLSSLVNNPRGSCALYAQLSHEMFKLAGLNSRLIYGSVKTVLAEGRGSRMSHAWNVVSLEGQWWTVDSTWGAGYLSDQGFVKQPTDLFFMIPASWVALNYFDPSDSVGAQREAGISQAEFNRLSEGGLYAAAFGFSPAEVLRVASKGEQLVETYSLPEGAFRVVQAPIGRYVSRGVQHFVVDSSLYEEMVLVQGDDWTYLNKQRGRFDGNFRPKQGELLLMGRKPGQDEFEALLGYMAR